MAAWGVQPGKVTESELLPHAQVKEPGIQKGNVGPAKFS